MLSSTGAVFAAGISLAAGIPVRGAGAGVSTVGAEEGLAEMMMPTKLSRGKCFKRNPRRFVDRETAGGASGPGVVQAFESDRMDLMMGMISATARFRKQMKAKLRLCPFVNRIRFVPAG